ncbi:hypothetical protein KBC80_01270 [Candidatus Woesebacteria bacterium]|nr:hypothetical protein [Candidatus Woesebacteria bacterium]
MTPFHTRQLALMRQMESALAANSKASEIVAMQSDYANDDALCLTTVSYIPKSLAESIRTAIIEPLAVIDPDQYYFPNSSMHVTIHNIRVVRSPQSFTDQDIQHARQLLRLSIPTFTAPTFELVGLLSMPTSVSIIALVNPEFDHMVKSIRHQFTEANLADDKKYFTDEITFANITICRYTKSPSKLFLETVQKNKETKYGIFSPKETCLVTSNAGMHPSKTTIIESFAFHNI